MTDMVFMVYDAFGNLRFQSSNWPMARSALDFVIQDAQELASPKNCPRLQICLEENVE